MAERTGEITERQVDGESSPAQARAPSRHRGTVRRPVSLPSSPTDLSPTAQRLLEAARRVFERDGFDALSYEAIGHEASLSPSLIRYHFGSKRELLVILASSLMYQFTSDRDWPLLPQFAGAEPAVRMLGHEMSELVTHLEAFTLFFELLPHLVRDERSRALLADMYRGLIELRASRFDAPDQGPGGTARVRLLVGMSMALTAGLAVQRLADPDLVDVEGAMSEWTRWLVWSVEHAPAEPPST